MSRGREQFNRLLERSIVCLIAETAIGEIKQWDEGRVNRHPAGVSEGGQFAPSGTGGAGFAPKKPPKPATPPAKPSAVAGFRGTASSQFKGNIEGSIRALPSPILISLADANVDIRADTRMTDTFPGMKGKTPPGYPKGTTVDCAPGVYDGDSKIIVVTESQTCGADTSQATKDEAVGTLYHEIGHATDDVVGKEIGIGRLSDSKIMTEGYTDDVKAFKKEHRDFLAYYLQEGERGRREAFAEVFAWTMGGKGTHSVDVRPYFPRLTIAMQTFKDNLEAEQAKKPVA